MENWERFKNDGRTRKQKRKAINDQFQKSIELGFITQEEVDEYRVKKNAEKKKRKRIKKPIIYLGLNTNAM